jgi:SAM-dependent methyltransferase
MCIAHLFSTQPAPAVFIDERAPFESVIDDRSGNASSATAIPSFAKCVGREGHSGIRLATARTVIRVWTSPTNNTCSVTTVVRYGASVADESELRLCGDVAGKRVIELGIGAPSNAVALATAGARAMAVDPSSDRIALVRRQAEQAEVTVQCHHGDVADLGFATSGSIDLVIASHTLQEVDDLARLLRQIHRVLRPEAPFVMAGPHPIAAMLTTTDGQQVVQRSYGAGPARSISDVFMAMQRTNFRIDVIHELFPMNTRTALTPAVLVIRARKLGV